MRALFLLLAMVWQTLGLLTPVNVADRATSLSHLVQHCEDFEHHHHMDQSLHADSAEESAPHVHADGGFGSAGPIRSDETLMGKALPVLLAIFKTATIPSPYLEGPLRPPQRLA
jgi:hypothetical protein